MLEISPMEIAKANNWNMVPIYTHFKTLEEIVSASKKETKTQTQIQIQNLHKINTHFSKQNRSYKTRRIHYC